MLQHTVSYAGVGFIFCTDLRGVDYAPPHCFSCFICSYQTCAGKFLVLFVSTFKEENYKPADFVVSSGRAPWTYPILAWPFYGQMDFPSLATVVFLLIVGLHAGVTNAFWLVEYQSMITGGCVVCWAAAPSTSSLVCYDILYFHLRWIYASGVLVLLLYLLVHWNRTLFAMTSLMPLRWNHRIAFLSIFHKRIAFEWGMLLAAYSLHTKGRWTWS